MGVLAPHDRGESRVEHGVHASARERLAIAVNVVPCSGNVLTLEMVHTVVVSSHQHLKLA